MYPEPPQITTRNLGAALQSVRIPPAQPDIAKIAGQLKSLVGVFSSERNADSTCKTRVAQWLTTFEEIMLDKFECDSLDEVDFSKLSRILYVVLDQRAATWARDLACTNWTELRT